MRRREDLGGEGGRDGGRVLNLDGRERVMNINFFLSFFKKELSWCVWQRILLCLDYQYIIIIFTASSLTLCFCLYLSISVSLSHFSFCPGFGGGDGQRPCTPPTTHPRPSHRKPLEADWRGRESQSEGSHLLVQQVNDTLGDQ